MPIYEYSCKRCRSTFEHFHLARDLSAVRCPTCADDSVQRLMSASAFQLKGSGWYATDYKKPAAPTE
jgi:putative FmdB family regulatory protein